MDFKYISWVGLSLFQMHVIELNPGDISIEAVSTVGWVTDDYL